MSRRSATSATAAQFECEGEVRLTRTVHRTQMILVDLSRDRATQIVAAVLVESPMDPTVDACVIDVVEHLFELCIFHADEAASVRP